MGTSTLNARAIVILHTPTLTTASRSTVAHTVDRFIDHTPLDIGLTFFPGFRPGL